MGAEQERSILMADRVPRGFRDGMTILELTTVLCVLCLLIQLLLPAVQSAREAARRLQCATHLKQMGLASMVHHDLWGRFPSGGWHFHWIGEPERGTDQDQPGSWVYNLLDYLGQSDLRRMGRDQVGVDRMEAIVRRCQTPLSMLHCPSRRDVDSYPHRVNRQPITRGGRVAEPLDWAAKSDYAANAGDQRMVEFDWQWPGPQSLAQGDDAQFRWPSSRLFTGVIFGRSRIRQRNVRDGCARTYLIGEKYIDASQYTTGEDWGDNENLFCGFNNDVCRSTASRPWPDQPGYDAKTSFGSAHPLVWQVVCCDGSVHAMSFDVDPQLHRQLGNRQDHAPADAWRLARSEGNARWAISVPRTSGQ